MKTKSLLLISVVALLFTACKKDSDDNSQLQTGQLTEITNEVTMSRLQVAESMAKQIFGDTNSEVLLLPFSSEMEVACIKYATTGVEGNIIEASGIITYRADITTYDHILSVQHGTCDIANAPTHVGFPIEAMAALKGEVVVMADYLGYGNTERPDLVHPYMHSTLTGTTCADMISAAEQYLENHSGLQKTGDGIKLMGYSQGGAATVSTTLELESRGLKDRIQDVWAGGGPHDLRVFFGRFSQDPDTQYNKNGYLPFVIRGLDYGDRLNLNYHNIYAQEIFDKGYDELFDNTQLSQLHSILGNKVGDVLHPDFFTPAPDFNGNKDIQTFYSSLERHTLVTGPKPQTAIKLYHSPLDDTVPYECSELAHAAWPNTMLTDLSASSHIVGGVEFILTYMRWQGELQWLIDFLEQLNK